MHLDPDGHWVWLAVNAGFAAYDGYKAYKAGKNKKQIAWAVASNFIKPLKMARKGLKVARLINGRSVRGVTRQLTEKRRVIRNISHARNKFLGHDHVQVSPGKWRNRAGTRQFRAKANNIHGRHGNIGPHVHFEFWRHDGVVTKNVHVPYRRNHRWGEMMISLKLYTVDEELVELVGYAPENTGDLHSIDIQFDKSGAKKILELSSNLNIGKEILIEIESNTLVNDELSVNKINFIMSNETVMKYEEGTLSISIFIDTFHYFLSRLEEVLNSQKFFPAEIIDVSYKNTEVSLYGIYLK